MSFNDIAQNWLKEKYLSFNTKHMLLPFKRNSALPFVMYAS